MALITLRVLDGADRGRIFDEMATPLTVGREEGNPIQLNDERVSRFHLKIQEDEGRVVLTDLQSTNGTKVNGENVQMWLLRPGDVIAVGRSTLLFGSEEEIARRLAELRGADLSAGIPPEADDDDQPSTLPSLDEELNWGLDADDQAVLHTLMPPELPDPLGPAQTAQVAELLQFVHLRLRRLIASARVDPGSDIAALEQRQWQNLLDLQNRLAGYLREIGEPEE